MFMSSIDLFLMVTTMFLLSSSFQKWKNSLMIIVVLEMTSLVLLAGLMMNGSFSSFLLTLLVFFVGESLILLSALFRILMVSGTAHSSLTIV